mmetsp:Transcript_6750/g.16468  ORF Transcript_6750/g.16468 Transcript_6750/m.16468 type:complete len:435 (-) Transcript_6750:1391-2695(-)
MLALAVDIRRIHAVAPMNQPHQSQLDCDELLDVVERRLHRVHGRRRVPAAGTQYLVVGAEVACPYEGGPFVPIERNHCRRHLYRPVRSVHRQLAVVPCGGEQRAIGREAHHPHCLGVLPLVQELAARCVVQLHLPRPAIVTPHREPLAVGGHVHRPHGRRPDFAALGALGFRRCARLRHRHLHSLPRAPLVQLAGARLLAALPPYREAAAERSVHLRRARPRGRAAGPHTPPRPPRDRRRLSAGKAVHRRRLRRLGVDDGRRLAIRRRHGVARARARVARAVAVRVGRAGRVDHLARRVGERGVDHVRLRAGADGIHARHLIEAAQRHELAVGRERDAAHAARLLHTEERAARAQREDGGLEAATHDEDRPLGGEGYAALVRGKLEEQQRLHHNRRRRRRQQRPRDRVLDHALRRAHRAEQRHGAFGGRGAAER